MRTFVLLASTLILVGCGGQVREFADNGNPPSTSDRNSEGIRVFMPALMKVTYRTTTFSDSSKATSYACNPTYLSRIEPRPDYGNPLRVRFDGSPLSTYTFNVTLNSDGILTGVNSANTPPIASVAPLITAITGAIGALGFAKSDIEIKKGPDTPDCTANPEVVQIGRCVESGGVICKVD